jgi:hypothetical protein
MIDLFKDRPLAIMLMIALLSIFVLQNHKNGFGEGNHGSISSHGATLAKNISIKHHLVMFNKINVSDDGKISFDCYNRFPIFTFILLKAIMLFFEPNLASQIYYSRQFMNIFLALSMLITFLMVKDLTNDLWMSLIIVLLTFSGYYILLYADMIFNETPSLFGFLLALYLALKCRLYKIKLIYLFLIPIISISLGWQPYAVFITWFFLETINSIKMGKNFSQIIAQPSCKVLFISIIWGIIILGFQLTNEWWTTGKNFGDLGTVKRMLGRLGITPLYQSIIGKKSFSWPVFIGRQSVHMTLIFYPIMKLSVLQNNVILKISAMIVIFSIICVSFIKLLKNRSIDLLFILLLFTSGIVWAVAMRHYTFYHNFESIFYIGIPICTYLGISLFIPQKFVRKITFILFLVFIANLWVINNDKNIEGLMANEITKEFQKIYNNMPRGSNIFIDDECTIVARTHAVHFYLAGHYFSSLRNANFVISANKHYNQSIITNNRKLNLFRNPRTIDK